MADPATAPDTAQSAADATESVPVEVTDQLFRYLQDGGPILYLLLVISVIALTLIIVKLIQLWILRVHARGFIDPVLHCWQEGRRGEAVGLLKAERSPVARVLETALRGSSGGVGEELLKEEISRVASRELDNLRTGLRPLALIASISPLIGLLGTVIGMINAFQALQDAGSAVDPSILSGGIWVALLTTAAGLIVAIPAAAAHNWMEGIVYRAQRVMEDAVTQVFTAGVVQEMGTGHPTSPHGARAQPAI